MKQHWYLLNWNYETVKNGRGKQVRKLVYRGEYYRIRIQERHFLILKIAYGMLFVLLMVAYGLLSLCETQGSMLFLTGAPCMLAVIPLMYLGIGICCFLIAPRKMTSRDVHTSVYFMKIASKWAIALFGLSMTGELVFVIFRTLSGLEVKVSAEWLRLAYAALCLSDCCVILYLIRQFPAEALPNQL
ncbi:MAG: hypothetical protein H6Q60_796 [Oscillospiraceae bacterium]|nr:hypothetical protein [Oscillospiraceae bacterium]